MHRIEAIRKDPKRGWSNLFHLEYEAPKDGHLVTKESFLSWIRAATEHEPERIIYFETLFDSVSEMLHTSPQYRLCAHMRQDRHEETTQTTKLKFCSNENCAQYAEFGLNWCTTCKDKKCKKDYDDPDYNPDYELDVESDQDFWLGHL